MDQSNLKKENYKMFDNMNQCKETGDISAIKILTNCKLMVSSLKVSNIKMYEYVKTYINDILSYELKEENYRKKLTFSNAIEAIDRIIVADKQTDKVVLNQLDNCIRDI